MQTIQPTDQLPAGLRRGGIYRLNKPAHDWHGREVHLLRVEDGQLIVALCCDIYRALCSPPGSRHRRLLLSLPVEAGELFAQPA